MGLVGRKPGFKAVDPILNHPVNHVGRNHTAHHNVRLAAIEGGRDLIQGRLRLLAHAGIVGKVPGKVTPAPLPSFPSRPNQNVSHYLGLNGSGGGKLLGLADVSLIWHQMAIEIRSIRTEAVGPGETGGQRYVCTLTVMAELSWSFQRHLAIPSLRSF